MKISEADLFEKIEAFLADYPICQYGFLKSEDILFSDKVRYLLCEALRVSPTYLLAEVLPSMEFSDMDVLWELWQTATPKQIAMMSSMIRSALEASKD